MSLKAKLEAVIYAAEEPVTLAQLTALFASEALALKAEQEAAERAKAGEQLPLSGTETTVEPIDEPPSESEDSQAPVVADEAPAEQTAVAEEGAVPAQEPAPSDEADAEAAAKKLAKAQEREARGAVKQVLDELVTDYAVDGRGLEIREIAGGYRMATKPEVHDAVRLFVKSLKPAMKLSLPALETLAVIAYKQPVTAPEVNEIRGVDSSGVFGSLLSRKLIATAGRKQVVGRPILYKTTREFLLRFGLKDVTELPSMEEFEKMAASELAETDDATENELVPAEEFTADASVEDTVSETEPAQESVEMTTTAEPLANGAEATAEVATEESMPAAHE